MGAYEPARAPLCTSLESAVGEIFGAGRRIAGILRRLSGGPAHAARLRKKEGIMTDHITEKGTAAERSRTLHDRYLFRSIRPEEGETAADIEAVCFPPNEACSREMMLRRTALAPDLFLVAEDRETGAIAGFLNGLATEEERFRDDFFTDAELHDPAGRTVMLCGLDVLPAYRGQGLARELMAVYRCRERERGRRRLVLTCLEGKVPMYEGMGFRDLGLSASSWGGESWHEMDLLL